MSKGKGEGEGCDDPDGETLEVFSFQKPYTSIRNVEHNFRKHLI